MTVLSLAASIIPLRQRWQEERQDIELRSVFGSQILQPVPPVWATELEFDDRADWLAGDIKALWMQLAGGNQLEVYDTARPAPLGTLRGALTLAADVAQGATSMQLKRANDNLLAFPESFDNAAWSKGGSTVNPDVSAAPDGLFVADRINKDALGFRNIVQTFTGVAGSTYAASIFGKADTLSKLTILLTGDNAATIHGRVIFDFVAKTAISASSTNLAALGISDFGNGWFSCWLAATLPVATSCRMYLYPDQYNNTAAGSVFMWGAKVNQGVAPTAYGFGLTLLSGDLLGIGSGSKQQVVMVTQDATSTGQGNITVNFEHPLRNAFTAGTAVTWDKPKALFRLRNNRPGWDYERSRAKNLKFDLVESVYS